jgi:hypothetical protein
MAFYSHLWCMVRELASTGGTWPKYEDAMLAMLACSGPIEVAHLGARAGWRRGKDSETAPLCRQHHRDIDGRVGGRAPWYVALGRDSQRDVREKLVAMAAAYWDYLSDSGRASWDARAAAQRAGER